MSPTVRWWCEHLVPAVPEDADEAERGQQVDERHEARPQPGLVHRAVVDAVGLGRRAGRAACRSTPKPFTTRTPVTLSSTTPDTSESSFCSCIPTGYMRWLKRVAEKLSSGSRPSANSASPGLRSTQDDDDRGHLDRARDRQRDEQDDVVDLLDVGVRVRHQLAGLGLVVEREVQALEVRDEPHADVGLDAPRQAERGVAPQPGADRLHRADGDDRGR